MVYDLERGDAHFGAVAADAETLVWQLDSAGNGAGSLLSCPVQLDRDAAWVVRCDRVEFPPGGVAYRHTHPGPGIRYLLHGEIAIHTEGGVTRYASGEAWFEAGPEPVYAVASSNGPTAFVRVLVLPAEWQGRRTIRYVDPADEDKPKLQRATVLLEQPLVLP